MQRFFTRDFLKKSVILVIFLLIGATFFVLPLSESSVFTSPDETANAVAARAFAAKGDMRIEDPVLLDVSWLRPRSFVTQAGAMVPVGFLGFPMVIGFLKLIFGDSAIAFFVPLLALSAAFPLWRWMHRFGRTAQVVAVVTWLSFPTVVLYANRGLFADLPVVCFAMWSAYLLWDRRVTWTSVLSGLFFGLAVAMRPIELPWLVAWIAGAWLTRRNPTKDEKHDLAIFISSAFLPMIATAIIAWKTYGSPFAIGYFLRDSISGFINPTATPDVRRATSFFLPFGFHPRAMWFNVKSYLFGMWAPWTTIAIVAAIAFWKRRAARTHILLGIWTAGVGIFIYGQSIYQDHVGVNVLSSGNSFLRYLLPLSAIFALSAGALAGNVMEKYRSQRTRIIVATITFGLAYAGIGLALNGDDESILANATELQRYADIRDAAYQRFGPQTVILSDRSDKIFFPTFRVASPLPPFSKISSLVESAPATIALFSSTLDNKGIASWNEAGIELRPVFVNANQTMYVLTPYSTSSNP